MTFTDLGNATLLSDRGFQVRILSAWEIEYREGDRALTVLTDEDEEHDVALDVAAFSRWDGMAAGSELPKAEQERIEINFMGAMAHWGYSVVKRPFF